MLNCFNPTEGRFVQEKVNVECVEEMDGERICVDLNKRCLCDCSIQFYSKGE